MSDPQVLDIHPDVVSETYTDNKYRNELPLLSKLQMFNVVTSTRLETQLSFMAHTVYVDNPTNQWMIFPDAARYVPPYAFSAFHIPQGTQKALVYLEAPPGVTQAVQSGGTTAFFTFFERELPLPGSTVYGQAQGGNPGASSSGLFDGTTTADTTVRELPTQPCSEVFVQNDPTSTINIFIGSGTSQSVTLVPGASETLTVSNVNIVFYKTLAGTARLNWHARS